MQRENSKAHRLDKIIVSETWFFYFAAATMIFSFAYQIQKYSSRKMPQLTKTSFSEQNWSNEMIFLKMNIARIIFTSVV